MYTCSRHAADTTNPIKTKSKILPILFWKKKKKTPTNRSLVLIKMSQPTFGGISFYIYKARIIVNKL